MKNFVKLSFAMMILASVIGFFSCDEPIVSDLELTLSTDKSVYVNGDTVKISIEAVTTNDKITGLVVVKGGNPLVAPSVTDDQNYKETVNYVVNDADGEIEFTVTVNSENNIDPVVKTIKVNVVTSVEVTLGASTSPLPSFVNGTTLTTYTAVQAFANQASVDLVYTWSASDGAIIGAPSDASFTLANWTTKNATKIGRITEKTIAAIDAVNTYAVKNLVVGDVMGYVTVSGTKGIVIVKNIVVNSDGNVTYTFQVIK